MSPRPPWPVSVDALSDVEREGCPSTSCLRRVRVGVNANCKLVKLEGAPLAVNRSVLASGSSTPASAEWGAALRLLYGATLAVCVPTCAKQLFNYIYRL